MKLLAGAVTICLVLVWAPDATARSARALYYETETRTGTLAIERLDLTAPHTRTQIVQVGTAGRDLSVFGIAVASRYVFWTYQAGPKDRGAIMRASLTGGQVRQVVGNLPAPASLLVLHGFVYWADQDTSHVYWTWGGAYRTPNYTGRADAGGTRVQPRFLIDSLYPMALSPAG
jgi:hypothetical protein